MAEEVQQAKLLRERAAREARMEDAIVRARIRLEQEERLSWSRRLEQAALSVRPCTMHDAGHPSGLAFIVQGRWDTARLGAQEHDCSWECSLHLSLECPPWPLCQAMTSSGGAHQWRGKPKAPGCMLRSELPP